VEESASSSLLSCMPDCFITDQFFHLCNQKTEILYISLISVAVKTASQPNP